MTDIDLWGMNVYRWDVSYTAALEFAEKSDKALYFSELGADSYMKRAAPGFDPGPNQNAQAAATHTLLAPLFSDSVPSAGVAVFSFTDGWWKAGEPDQQDIGGWSPAGDGVPYDGSSNEEYWGLVDIDRSPKEAFAVVQSFFNGNTPTRMTDGKRKKAVYETSRRGGRFHALPGTRSSRNVGHSGNRRRPRPRAPRPAEADHRRIWRILHRRPTYSSTR